MFAAKPFPWLVFAVIHFTLTSSAHGVFEFTKTRVSIVIYENWHCLHIFEHFELRGLKTNKDLLLTSQRLFSSSLSL
jgi:hypothetical protein